MQFEYSDEELSKIKQFGMLEYQPKRICTLLGIDDYRGFLRELSDPLSEVHKYYNQGLELARLKVDKKLFDMAKEGDTDALELLKNSQRQAKIDELKKDLFDI